MSNNAPSLLYYFEHMFLRDSTFGSSDFLNLLKLDIDKFNQGLITNFNKIKENPNYDFIDKEIILADDDFSIEKVKFDNGVDIVVIKCPVPQKSPEAKYIGIVTTDTPRYFLCEYESNDEMKQLYPDKELGLSYILCEWVQKEHKNYGKIAETKEAFIEGVRKLISNP